MVVIHQKMAGQMVGEGLLSAYKDQIQTGSLVTRDTAKNALGANVSGYVMPMFHSQTAIAYNPDLAKDVPNSYAELIAWVNKNPKKFGYNGIKGGMSGVAFVTGWVYAFGGDAGKLMTGPYDAASKAAWDKALADLKEFNKNVVITPGNAGTLDMLNRGEIAMGPVWVDMFYTWMADGKLPPGMKLKLVAPGMPSPMYYAIPPRLRTPNWRRSSLRSRPARSARRRHRQEVQLVSGHRCKAPGRQARPGSLKKLFADISPEELKGMPFARAVFQRNTGSLRAQSCQPKRLSAPAAPAHLEPSAVEILCDLAPRVQGCFSTPALLMVGALFVYPFALSIASAFTAADGFPSTANFYKAFELYSGDIIFTLLIVASAAILIALAAIAIAGTLTLGESRWLVATLAALYRWPLFIPFIVAAQCMRTFLAKNGSSLVLSASSTPARHKASGLRGIIITFVWKQRRSSPFCLLGRWPR